MHRSIGDQVSVIWVFSLLSLSLRVSLGPSATRTCHVAEPLAWTESMSGKPRLAVGVGTVQLRSPAPEVWRSTVREQLDLPLSDQKF